MSTFWDEQNKIGEITKNKKEKIVISTCKRKNEKYLDVRINSASGDDFIPTSKGFNVKIEKLKDFLEILETI